MTTKVRAGALTLAFLSATGLGVLGSYLAQPEPSDGLASAPISTRVPLTPIDYTDPADIPFTLNIGEPTVLTLPSTGVLTATHCEPGKPIASGSSLAEIDGQPILAINTPSPFYRNLEEASTGKDVDALRQGLINLGYQIAPTGAYDAPLASAVQALQANAGITPADGTFRHSNFLWLPANTLTPTQCPLTLGQTYQPETPFAEVPAELHSIDFALPDQLVEGERTATVFTTELTLKGDSVTDVDLLQEISASAPYREYLAADSVDSNELTAPSQLVEPFDAVTLPPAALFDARGTQACLQSDTAVHRVRVLGSSLGSTIVAFESTEEPPKAALTGSAITERTC